MKQRPYHIYPRILRQKALASVFDSLVFNDMESGRILRDSYFMNLNMMMEHAHCERIDELEYLIGIRDLFLRDGLAHER